MNHSSNKDIEHLLAEKPFRLLSPEERYLVLDRMDEAEYERCHLFIERSKAAMRQQVPACDPALKGRLLEAFRKQHAPPVQVPGLWRRVVAYRIPAWQAAAAMALVLGAFMHFYRPPVPVLPAEKVYVNLTDTIYKEVALPARMDTAVNVPPSRVNVKPRAGRHLGQPVEALASADSSARRAFTPTGGVTDSVPALLRELDRPRGKSAADIRDLWDYVGEVY